MAMRLGVAFFELFARNRMGAGLTQAKSQTQTAMASMFKNISATVGAMFGLQKALQVTIGSLRSAITFQENMTRSLAIQSGITTELRNEMEGLAQTLAVKTGRAAEDLAESFFFLASAGLDAQQQIAALPSAAAFATAGAFNMATAVDLLTDAQSALGLTVSDATKNMQNMTRVSDVLVRANELANASVEQFSQALTSKAATAIRTYGARMEEGVAALAVFADQGIKSQKAGNALNIVLRDMSSAAIRNRAAFKAANVAVFDGEGKFRGIANVIEDLERKLSGMSDEMKKTTLLQLGFSDRSVSFTAALIGSSRRIREMDSALQDAGGSTQRVAEKQLESLNVQLKILVEQFKVMSLNILPGFIKAFRLIAAPFAKLAQMVGELDRRLGGEVGFGATFVGALLTLSAVIRKIAPVMLRFSTVILAKMVSEIAKAGVIGPVLNGFVGLLETIVGFVPGMGALARGLGRVFRASANLASFGVATAGIGAGFGIVKELRAMNEEIDQSKKKLTGLERDIAAVLRARRFAGLPVTEEIAAFVRGDEIRRRALAGQDFDETERVPGIPGRALLRKLSLRWEQVMGKLRELVDLFMKSIVKAAVTGFNKFVNAIGAPQFEVEKLGNTTRDMVVMITDLLERLNVVLAVLVVDWVNVWKLMESTAKVAVKSIVAFASTLVTFMTAMLEGLVLTMAFVVKALDKLTAGFIPGIGQAVEALDSASAAITTLTELFKGFSQSDFTGGLTEDIENMTAAWEALKKAVRAAPFVQEPEALPPPFVEGEDSVKKAAKAIAQTPPATPGSGRVSLFTAFEALGKEIQSALGGEDKLGEIADSTASSKELQEQQLRVSKKIEQNTAGQKPEMLPPPNVAEVAPAGAGAM